MFTKTQCVFFQLPFATDRLENLDSLFKPLAPTQRLHCVLESSESLPGYTLKYEHLNCYIPLLQARRTAGKLLTNCFIIEPAFSCSQQSQEKVASRTDSPVQEGEFWAHHVESPYQHDLPLPLSRNTAVLRNIRSVLRPTHRQVSQQGAAAATRVPQQPKAELSAHSQSWLKSRVTALRIDTTSPQSCLSSKTAAWGVSTFSLATFD